MGKIIKMIDGLPVFDAKRSLRLTITKADITKAATSIKEPNRCAVARACMRDLHVKEARVHLGRIYLRTNDHNWVRYMTPKTLHSEIVAFDRGGAFEPCEVTLRPVAPSQRLGYKKSPDGNRDTGKKRLPYHIVKNVRAGPA